VTPGRYDRGPYLRPDEHAYGDQRDGCPFCVGSDRADGTANEIRVIPNLYPAFQGDPPFVVNHLGPVFSSAPASGVHEVLLFSTDHDCRWSDLSDAQCALVMREIRDRIALHEATPGLRYSQALLNVGRDAGASIEHPHGQLLGIPFVPRELVDEQGAFSRFAGGCLLCTATASEERVGYRIISSDEHTVTFAPFWSGTPYEMLIVPRPHEPHLHAAKDEDLSGLGEALRDALAALSLHLDDVAYNVVFHSAPYRATSPYHWHVHILPKLTTRAGFELGTGVYVNVVAPEVAAEELRRALAKFRVERGQVAVEDSARK
jgi:UDPglucose--hexose-1-phosphate uridylyltransferase